MRDGTSDLRNAKEMSHIAYGLEQIQTLRIDSIAMCINQLQHSRINAVLQTQLIQLYICNASVHRIRRIKLKMIDKVMHKCFSCFDCVRVPSKLLSRLRAVVASTMPVLVVKTERTGRSTAEGSTSITYPTIL